MTEIAIIDESGLKDKIYEVRGQEVMLDFELAELYGYTTKVFNQQVRNNIYKFDDDFYFQLSDKEWENLRSHFLTSSYRGRANLRSKNLTSSWGGNRRVPYVFTEQGIYMLMTVLKGDLAVKQSKALIRTFKKMKDYLLNNREMVSWKDFSRLSEKVENHAEKINKILDEQREIKGIVKSFGQMGEKMLMDGKYVDADFVYKSIYESAKESIVIIDNYIGLRTLVLLKDIRQGVKCTVFSNNIGKELHEVEIEDFRKQYPDVKIEIMKLNDNVHDRFIVIDYGMKGEKFYHCGGSSKDAGKRKTIVTEMKKAGEVREMVGKLMRKEKK